MAGWHLAPMSFESRATALLRQFRTEKRTSARTLLVTVFGDSIEPRGGSIWLRDLIELVAPLGISDRLVRTSIQRLVAEGVLVGSRVGRHSRYSITESSRLDFRSAEERIYHRVDQVWDGEWRLVVLAGDRISPDARAALRLRLGWLGFEPVSVNVHASPVAAVAPVAELLAELGVDNDVIVLRARRLDDFGARDEDLARLCCNVEAVQGAYSAFLCRYRPLMADVGSACGLEPELAFCVRTVLVDDYRRIALRDPQLPSELLPSPWDGETAFEVAAAVYLAVRDAADAYLEATCATLGGPLPPLADRYRVRFRRSGPLPEGRR